MPKLTINGSDIEVAPGTSILQAAEQLGIEIPRFCYHDRLSVPANCRMCLVELEGAPKPVASCAMAAGDNMIVKTDSEKVKKARKGVMEMLLINHPLDCPVCDQGGECDLQDQAVGYGFDRSRYHENKRAVPDKDLGPLIKTSMNRCINCTRCVRFGEEIAGVPVLGQVNRGEDAEITTFVDTPVATELSGNMIDICPVGALTSKPYAFKARPWELKKTESIDVHDGLGASIRVDSRGREVLRILPRLNEAVNEEWIDDRTRFSCDGLKHGRLDIPYVRDPGTGKLRPATWEEAFRLAASRLRQAAPEKIAAFAGDLADSESVFALKDLMTALGTSNLECRVDGALFDTANRAGYLFNSTIAGVDRADAILLIGVNPRWEGAVLNARIRRAWMDRRVKIALRGPAVDLTYPYYHAGNGPDDLESVIAEKGGKTQSKNPMMIVGAGAFRRKDGMAVHALLQRAAEAFGCIAEGWNGFNVLHMAANRVGALDIGFTPVKPFKMQEMDIAYLLNVDNAEMLDALSPKAFVIYQGHHGDAGAARADVIFPGAAYTEKNALYVNTEGRVQMARKAVDAPGAAREDWRILRALSEVCGLTLPYDTLSALRDRLVKAVPTFGAIDTTAPAPWGAFGAQGPVTEGDFTLPVQDFYQTNVITRASPTMRECTGVFSEMVLAQAAE